MEEKAKSLKSKVEAGRIIMHDTRITVPKRFRDFLGLKDGSVFEIRTESKHLILQLIKR